MDKTDKKLWFARKRYGYGWTPTAWQGWALVISYLTLVPAGTLILRGAPRDEFSMQTVWYLIYVSALTALFVIITRAKGPKAIWRWGGKTDEHDKQ